MTNILSNEEINKIKRLQNTHIIDDTIKKKLHNYEKLQPFTKVIYKTKKNKYIRKLNKKIKETKYISDPYRFKEIPINIQNIISTFIDNNNISISTICYKLQIPTYILDSYLNSNGIIDNNYLYKILKYFNYTLDFEQSNITELKQNKYDENDEYEYENNDYKEYI